MKTKTKEIQTFEYHINLDERGEFYADVRKVTTDETVYEIHGFDIFEDGYMNDKKDMQGLHEYMVELGVIKKNDLLEYIG